MRKYVNGIYSDMTKHEEEQTKQMMIHEEISRLKNQLSKSDYLTIKFAEGLISEKEFESIKAERKKIRTLINELTNMKGEN